MASPETTAPGVESNEYPTQDANQDGEDSLRVDSEEQASPSPGDERCVEFRLQYLGASLMLQQGVTGSLGPIQKPLRELYFRYQQQGRKAGGGDRRLIISDEGLKMRFKPLLSAKTLEAGKRGVVEIFNPFDTVSLWAALKFGSVTDEARNRYGTFRPLDDDARLGDVDERLSFLAPLEESFMFLTELEHPALLAIVMRRTSGVRALECHVFRCASDDESREIVAAIDICQEHFVQGDEGKRGYRHYRYRDFGRRWRSRSESGQDSAASESASEHRTTIAPSVVPDPEDDPFDSRTDFSPKAKKKSDKGVLAGISLFSAYVRRKDGRDLSASCSSLVEPLLKTETATTTTTTPPPKKSSLEELKDMLFHNQPSIYSPTSTTASSRPVLRRLQRRQPPARRRSLRARGVSASSALGRGASGVDVRAVRAERVDEKIEDFVVDTRESAPLLGDASAAVYRPIGRERMAETSRDEDDGGEKKSRFKQTSLYHFLHPASRNGIGRPRARSELRTENHLVFRRPDSPRRGARRDSFRQRNKRLLVSRRHMSSAAETSAAGSDGARGSNRSGVSTGKDATGQRTVVYCDKCTQSDLTGSGPRGGRGATGGAPVIKPQRPVAKVPPHLIRFGQRVLPAAAARKVVVPVGPIAGGSGGGGIGSGGIERSSASKEFTENWLAKGDKRIGGSSSGGGGDAVAAGCGDDTPGKTLAAIVTPRPKRGGAGAKSGPPGNSAGSTGGSATGSALGEFSLVPQPRVARKCEAAAVVAAAAAAAAQQRLRSRELDEKLNSRDRGKTRDSEEFSRFGIEDSFWHYGHQIRLPFLRDSLRASNSCISRHRSEQAALHRPRREKTTLGERARLGPRSDSLFVSDASDAEPSAAGRRRGSVDEAALVRGRRGHDAINLARSKIFSSHDHLDRALKSQGERVLNRGTTSAEGVANFQTPIERLTSTKDAEIASDLDKNRATHCNADSVQSFKGANFEQSLGYFP